MGEGSGGEMVGDAALRVWMGEGGGGEWVVTRPLAFRKVVVVTGGDWVVMQPLAFRWWW
jgi:hypothetical protein